MAHGGEQITKVLCAIDRGENGAAEALLPLVYEELRVRAGKLLASERRDHSLQRTALVHEAYLKLAVGELSFQSRAHFFNAAGLAMRRILVDHAVRRARLKRGGGQQRIALAEDHIADDSHKPMDWVELDDALRDLEAASPRRYQVVMLRFFTGRTDAEIAELLQVSPATIRRDWSAARVWLYRAMAQQK